MKTHLTLLAAITAAATLSVSPALAQSVGDIASNLGDQGAPIARLLTIASFIFGVGCALGGLMMFRANQKNPNDPSNSVKGAFILMGVGGALVALPMVLGSGISTIWSDEGQQTNATEGFTTLN